MSDFDIREAIRKAKIPGLCIAPTCNKKFRQGDPDDRRHDVKVYCSKACARRGERHGIPAMDDICLVRAFAVRHPNLISKSEAESE